MITLFIDSSMKSLSVALASENKLLFVLNTESYSRHSNFLMNNIIKALNETNLSIYDVDNIIILNGPGSFTGVRVGVTIAKTLAWTLSKKLYQLSNLKALELQSDGNYDMVISTLYDKPNSSYVGFYENGLSEEAYLDIENIKDIHSKNIQIVSFSNDEFITNLKNKLSDNNVNVKIIDKYDYLKVINYALSEGNINPHIAEPIYLKKIDVEKRQNND